MYVPFTILQKHNNYKCRIVFFFHVPPSPYQNHSGASSDRPCRFSRFFRQVPRADHAHAYRFETVTCRPDESLDVRRRKLSRPAPSVFLQDGVSSASRLGLRGGGGDDSSDFVSARKNGRAEYVKTFTATPSCPSAGNFFISLPASSLRRFEI